MLSQSSHGAKILAFPGRHLLSTALRRRIGPQADRRDDTPAAVPCATNGWYHEAALLDADRTRKP